MHGVYRALRLRRQMAPASRVYLTYVTQLHHLSRGLLWKASFWSRSGKLRFWAALESSVYGAAMESGYPHAVPGRYFVLA